MKTNILKRLGGVASVICALAAAPAGAATYTALTDLNYGPNDRNQLDLYIPNGVSDAPLVMWIHGGAWFAGDKANPPALQEFIDRGIAVASMNYRLSSNLPFNPPTTVPTQWPGQLEDVRNAFAFLRGEAGSYGFDGTRLGAFGFSAGAHLAAWAGLDLAGDPLTRLTAVATYAPPTDLANMDADDDADSAAADAIVHNAPDSPESRLIGATVGDPANRALADAASPAVYAAALAEGTALPSFYMRHGSEDALVSSLQSQRLYDELVRINGSATLDFAILAGAPHEIYPGELSPTVKYFAQEFGVAPVPLPASLPLALAGLAALFGLRRRSSSRGA